MIDHHAEALASIDKVLGNWLPHEPEIRVLHSHCVRCAAVIAGDRAQCDPCRDWSSCVSDDDPLDGRSLSPTMWDAVAQGKVTLDAALRVTDSLSRTRGPWPPLSND